MSSAAMTAPRASLVPDVDQGGVTKQQPRDMTRRAPRHMFSPFLTFDLKLDFGLVGFRSIRQGVIRSFKEYHQRVRNTEAVRRAFNVTDSLETSEVDIDQLYERDAATIAEGIMRTYGALGDATPGTPTGLIVLDPLQGLDHTRTEDYEMLALVQETLWPENYDTALQHRDYLERVDLSPLMEYGDEFVTRVEKTRDVIFNKAIPGAEAYCRKIADELGDELKKNAMGLVGNRARYSPREAAACRWISLSPPERPASVFEGASTVKDLTSITTQLLAQNQAMLEQFSKGAGQPAAQSPEMLTVISQLMANQSILMERLSMPVAVQVEEPVEEAKTETKKRNGNK